MSQRSSPSFLDRASTLPKLGLGISTEYGAAGQPGALSLPELRRLHPAYARFLEVGVETAKGIDGAAEAWIASGGRTTYHFLDVNLDDPDDFDEAWLTAVRALTERLRPAWLCGDAGLWHFGRRERGHMLLLPPILCADSAHALAEGILRLRESTGYEVLPENPPGSVYLGDLHLLDFYARVCDEADTGMLLDAAHLAIYQRMCGHAPLTGLDAFPLERIIEMHVAGGVERRHEGFGWIEDSHTPVVLDDSWAVLEAAVAGAGNLRAVVFECERNPLSACLPGFARIAELLEDAPLAQEREDP